MIQKIFFLATISLLLFGCGLPIMQKGGVMPASIATDVRYPAEFNGAARFNIDTKVKFNILGNVSAIGESINILGIVAHGDNGYTKLLEAAKRMGADDVINITSDIKYNYYIFGAYQKITTNLSGTAIKYEVDGKPINFYYQTPQFYNPPTGYNYSPAQYQGQYYNQQAAQQFAQPAQPQQIQQILPKTDIPDKNKSYYLLISGQQYGPITFKQIEDMKRMGYCNNETVMIDSETNKFYKVGELFN